MALFGICGFHVSFLLWHGPCTLGYARGAGNERTGATVVNSFFEELNLFVYHTLRGVVFDGIIWCLGPFVDDVREYGRFRCYLALATRYCCRTWLARTP